MKIFAIHGGGNIGLGLMADIISQSHCNYNYKIIATSSDVFTNNLINSTNKFGLQHANDKSSIVNNVHMIYSRDSQNIINLYKQASMLAICLTENAIQHVANDIAKGLLERHNINGSALKILVLMNKPNCHQFVKNKIEKYLLLETESLAITKEILAKVKFIPTVVDRIVNKIPKQKIIEQLKNQLAQFTQYSDSILEQPEKLAQAVKDFNVQFNLFNAEKKFVLYLPYDFQEAGDFPAITRIKNLEAFTAVKNKLINGPHAILAWLGGLKGYKTIAEAIKDPHILEFIKNVMENEIAPILKIAYSDVSEVQLESLKNSFIQRCRQSVNDPVLRVGRDPLRKLNRDGCIRGVIEIKKRYGLKTSIAGLEKGIAAGILYAINRIDPNNAECQKIYNVYLENKSYHSAFKLVMGLNAGARSC